MLAGTTASPGSSFKRKQHQAEALGTGQSLLSLHSGRATATYTSSKVLVRLYAQLAFTLVFILL